MTSQTDTLVQSADTIAGFAIGIVRNHRSGFLVVRMDRSSRYVTLSVHSTEAGARTAANAAWSADKAAA